MTRPNDHVTSIANLTYPSISLNGEQAWHPMPSILPVRDEPDIRPGFGYPVESGSTGYPVHNDTRYPVEYQFRYYPVPLSLD